MNKEEKTKVPTFKTWDDLFEFQSKTDGANYQLLKQWLKKHCAVPGPKFVPKANVFLMHAKFPNFGIGEHVKFNEDNFRMVAEARTELTSSSAILEWIFKKTQNTVNFWGIHAKDNNITLKTDGPVRSTSVGDVVVARLNYEFKFWRCENFGWTEIKTMDHLCHGCLNVTFPFDECDCE